ncbi:purine-binding chemotaxis protein CheW [bacterium]|nr:purine-binding chemotaxis protein CheW [bacterium]
MQLNDRFLAFTVDQEQYAVALVNVREVIGESDITPVPFTPHFMRGILNLRGQVISVIDLRARFGLHPADSSAEMSTLILEVNGSLLGMVVDSVDFVLRMQADQLEAPPAYEATPLSRFVDAVARTDRQLIVILSSEKLFSFEESFVTGARSPSAVVA